MIIFCPPNWPQRLSAVFFLVAPTNGSGGYWQCFFLFPASNPHIFFTAQLFNMCCMSSQGGQWRQPCNFWKPHFMSLPGVWSDDYLSIFELFSFFELFWIFTSCRLVGHVLLVFCLECHQMIVQLISCDFSTRDFIKVIGFLVFSSNLLIFVPPNFNFTSGPIVPGCGC